MFSGLRRVFIDDSDKKSFWFFGSIGLLLLIFYTTMTVRIDRALEDLISKNERLSKEISLLESQVIRAKEVKEKLYQLESIVESYRSFLPRGEDINGIAILLGSSAKNSDLELEKLTFKKEGEKVSVFNLKLSGNFFSLINFLDKVWTSPFLIGVKSFNLSAAQDDSLLKVDIAFAVLER